MKIRRDKYDNEKMKFEFFLTIFRNELNQKKRLNNNYIRYRINMSLTNDKFFR